MAPKKAKAKKAPKKAAKPAVKKPAKKIAVKKTVKKKKAPIPSKTTVKKKKIPSNKAPKVAKAIAKKALPLSTKKLQSGCMPVEKMTPADFAFYEPFPGLSGCKTGAPPGYIFKNLGLNSFADEPTEVPPDAKLLEKLPSPGWISHNFWDPKKRRLVGESALLPAAATGKAYLIMDQGATAFVAYVRPGTVSVFKKPTDGYIAEADEPADFQAERLFFQELVATYNNVRKTWIGVDRELWDSSELPGNSILVQVSATRYVYIGSQIYSFELPEAEPIVAYYSYRTKSVPYPVGLTASSALFMNDADKVPRAELEAVVTSECDGDWGDAYDAYGDLTNLTKTPLANKTMIDVGM